MKKEMTKVQRVIVLTALILIVGVGIHIGIGMIEEQSMTDPLEKVEGEADEIVKSKAKVQVSGEVVNPGIYEAELDMRVQEVIDMAGGFTEKANRDKVNLVAYVKDGQKIDVPERKEEETASKSSTKSSSKSSSSKSSSSKTTSAKTPKPTKESTPEPEPTPEPTPVEHFSISINTASADDFASVEGVSRTVAENIVAYRDSNGPFETLESLMDVPGVTLKVYQALEPFLQN